jgi:hypothetical protein
MASVSLKDIRFSYPILDSVRLLKTQILRSAAVGGRLKRESAHKVSVEVLNGLSLEIKNGERVGLLGGLARPLAGRFAVGRLADALYARDDSGVGAPPPVRLARHAGVVLFGDVLGPLEATDASVRALASAGARGRIVHIVDPAEEGLPYAGRTRFEGLEDEAELLVSRVENVRAEYRRVFESHVAGLRDIARAYGWGYVEHRTDRPP